MENLFKFIFVAIILGVVQGEEQCSQKRQDSIGKGNRLIDQDFGLELTADDLITSMMSPWMFRDYYRPWRYMESLTRDLGSTIKSEKDKFTINLDVQHFAPEEISVKTADGYVVVEAKHEEKKDDHGLISRQFLRRYALPEGAETADVVSQLSSDGILTITAPKKEVDGKGERVVPITQTGPVRQEAKESKEEKSCSAKEKCKN
ncbi:protein lethal(2)essential for life-like [Pararge aegeria]|uniref:Jg16979 protein n=2 Tax=Pararge aegeria TaxID=116150 RepID=A0A8S4RHV5_9NEOP|nr:protein lethal(2)essential for life-like [Pararge aegeria]CAH2236741.1 jg16979 [Pararge aegeria aegeria]